MEVGTERFEPVAHQHYRYENPLSNVPHSHVHTMRLLSSQRKQHLVQRIVLLSLFPLVTSHSALIRWLDQLRVEIPNQSFQAGFVHLYVNDLVCSHFGMEQIESSNADDGELKVTIGNVSATCHGSYRTSIHFVEGDLTATIGAAKHDRNALEWTVHLLDNTTVPEVLRPKGVTTVNCQLGLAMTDLHFENGASTVFNLFHDMIESAINKQLACDKFQSIVDEQATMYIASAMQWLDPYILQGQQRQQLRAVTGSELTSTASRLPKRVVQFLTVANNFVESHLDHGLLPNATQCGGFAAGFNGVLQEHNSLSIHQVVELERSLPQNSTLSLRLSDWYLSGLDDWEQLVVLRPDAAAFQTHLETHSNVNLTVAVEFNISKPSQEDLTEIFDITLSMKSLRAVLGTELGMDEGVQIGSMVKGFQNLEYFLPCVGFEKIRVKEADVDIDLTSLVVEGKSSSFGRRHGMRDSYHRHYGDGHRGHDCRLDRQDCDASLEEEMDEVITNTFELVLRQYPIATSLAVTGLVKGPGVGMANQFFEDSLQRNTNCTLETEDSVHHRTVNFTKTPLLWANEHLNRSLPALNRFIDCATQVVEDRLNLRIPGTIDIHSLGSLQELNILYPENSTLLSSAVLWGANDEASPSTKLNIQIPDVLTSAVMVTIQTVAFDVDTFVEYDRSLLLDLELSRLLSECIALPIEELSFPVFDGSIAEVQVYTNVSFLLEGNRSVALSFDSTEYNDFSSAFHEAVEWYIQFLEDGVDWGSTVAVESARRACGAQTDEDQDKTNTMILILSTLFVLAQPLIMLMRRGRASDVTPRAARNIRDGLLEPLITFDHENDVGVNNVDTLISQAGQSSQYLVPIAILFTLGLFIASNISVGASVQVISKFDLPSLYDFGLLNTAEAMLKAKVYPLFLLIVLFSGAWPYAKLLLMLVAWICPTTILSFETRESLLTKLDALSKYSLIDTYVLVVMLVSFRYHLAFLDNNYSLDIYVVPKFGFYGFLLATMISLGLGHVLVAFHRGSAARPAHTSTPTYESALSFTFYLSDGSSGKLSSCFGTSIALSVLVAMGLIAYGSTRESFIFEIGGVAGYLLGKRSRSSYSLLSIGAAIPPSVPGGLAVYFLQVSYYFYTIVTPFAALLALLVLMLVPAVPRYQARMLVFAEVANAWSAIEVFVVSIVAAVFQVSQFARFIVGNRCDFVGKILERNNFPDPVCFSVKCTVTYSALFLIFGALMYTGTVWILLRIARSFVTSRLEENATAEPIDRWIPRNFLTLEEQDLSMPPVVSESIEEESETTGQTWDDWQEATNVT